MVSVLPESLQERLSDMLKNTKKEEALEREVYCGIWPVLKNERVYHFFDALLVLSGYCIATWSYTQGSYLASLVGFKQLLIGAFLGALLMLLIYQLPVILSTRYGIDIWIWLRSVFGTKGVKVVTVLIIFINFPWYAVCCDLFASSMENGMCFYWNFSGVERCVRNHLDDADFSTIIDACGNRSRNSRIYIGSDRCNLEL